MDTITKKNISSYQIELFHLEANYDEQEFQKWMEDNWIISVVSAAVYVAVIFGGKLYMENRQRFELRYPLAMWSGLLAIFSIVGTIRTAPLFFEDLTEGGIYHTICDNAFLGKKPTNFWCYMFTISKIYELGDTLFIVLRKQPLIFLHYYHHITVLIYVWYSYPQRIANGRWFMIMNFFVHSLMYSYYALRALKFKIPKQVNIFITFLQIMQMVIGLAVNFYSAHIMNIGVPCEVNWPNFQYSIAMYVSYFILFAKFFYDAYVKPKFPSVQKSIEAKDSMNGRAAYVNQSIKRKEE